MAETRTRTATNKLISELNGAELTLQAGTVQIAAAAAGKKVPTVRILAYSGGIMDPSWPPTKVVVDLAGVSFRTNPIPLLRDHNQNKVLGQGRGSVDKGGIVITGRLNGIRREVEDIVQPAGDGLEWRASISGALSEIEIVEPGKTKRVNGRTLEGPVAIARKCVVAEVSILAVAGDPDTSVSIAAAGRGKVESNMAKVRPDNPPIHLDPPAIDVDHLEADGEMTTVERALEVAKIAVRLGDDDLPTLRAAAERGDIPIAAFRHAAAAVELERIRASRPHVRPTTGLHPMDMPDITTDVLGAAALIAAGFSSQAERAYGADIANRAADLRITNAVDLCKTALSSSGREVPRTADGILRASFSNIEIPAALGSSSEKMMADAFRNTPATWRSWCASKPVKNFRVHKSLRGYMSDGGFEEVAASGELKHGVAVEEVYEHSASTFGRIFSVTRKDIINDDLGVIFELAAEIGRQGLRKISDEVYRLLLSDAGTFFVLNSNYIEGSGTVLSVDSVPTLLQYLRKATDGSGMPIDIPVSCLLVPPELEVVGRAIIQSTEVRPASGNTKVDSPTGNPLAGIATLEVEPRLSNAKFAGYSATGWYLMGKPSPCPPIIVSFLNGTESPVVEQVELPASVLGIGYRGYVDCGVDWADSRGAAKSKGAA